MLERNYAIDKMKFLCMIAVVCIHTNPFGNKDIGLMINILCRVAVPLFFISSGYLLNSKFSYEYVHKYFIKIFKLFLSWIIFYILLDLTLKSISNIVNGNHIFYEYKEYFSNFKILDIYYASGIIKKHLWYLSSILCVIPILYITIKYKMVKISLFISLILNIIGIFIYNQGSINIVTTRDTIFFAYFYCMIGIYISHNQDKIEAKVKNYRYIFFTIGIFMFYIISLIERVTYDKYFMRTGDYYISTIPLAIFIFLVCIKSKNTNDTIISRIGRRSLGVYLTHVAFIDLTDIILYKLNLLHIVNAPWYQLTYTALIIVISYLSYSILQYVKINIYKLLEYKEQKIFIKS